MGLIRCDPHKNGLTGISRKERGPGPRGSDLLRSAIGNLAPGLPAIPRLGHFPTDVFHGSSNPRIFRRQEDTSREQEWNSRDDRNHDTNSSNGKK
jgi:hypothetical protein